MLKAVTSLALIFFYLSVVVSADVINVPGEQPTIQAGINAAVHGDTVLVADGLYTGPGNRDINFGGRNITVKSESGPLSCIIDVQASASQSFGGFYLNSGESELAVIEGFTIRNAYVHGSGAAIHLGDAAPVIRNNRIENCHADSHGGGIYSSEFSSPVLIGNTISGNESWEWGGGIFAEGYLHLRDNLIELNSAALGGGIYADWGANFTNNRIIGNSADYGGALASLGYSYIVMENTLVADNHAAVNGGAFWFMDEANCWFDNCTLAGNSAGSSGGVLYGVVYSFYGSFRIDNSIIWGNSPDNFDASGLTKSFAYTDIEGGWSGEGNIDADPLFVTGPLGDWYLSQTSAGQAADSPCLDSGSVSADVLCYEYVGNPICMSELTTRTDRGLDSGQVDMGYHYPAAGSVSASLACIPVLGTLPFATAMEVTLANRFVSQTRRIAGRIHVQLAGGGFFSNWRAGYTNVAGGSSYTTSWSQTIPALGSLIGDNHFILGAEDVTAAPYNQPPYPPAGDTDTASCTVTGIAP